MKKSFTLSIFSLLLTFALYSQTVPSWIPSSGLKGYWGFDNNENDYSGNGNNATTVTNAAAAPDRHNTANSAKSFVGTGVIKVLNSASLGFSGPRTIACWFKTTSTGRQCLMTKYSDATGGPGLGMLVNATKAEVYAGKTACNAAPLSSTVVNNNAWHLLVGIAAGDSIKQYIDGKFELVTPLSNTCGQTTSTTEEYNFGTNDANTVPYTGFLDDIGVWDRILTDCEIAKMFLETDLLITQPQNKSGAVNGSTQISVTGGAGVTYQWQVNTGIGGFTNLSNAGQYSGVTTNTLTISNLNTINNGYLYQCIVTFGRCVVTSSTATLSVTTGIEEVVSESGFSLTPNPAQKNTTLMVSSKFLNEPYRIFNSVGQEVLEGKLTDTTTQIDLSQFSKGIYTIQLAGAYTRQLVVIN